MATSYYIAVELLVDSHGSQGCCLVAKWVPLLAYIAGLVQYDFSLRSCGWIPPMSGTTRTVGSSKGDKGQASVLLVVNSFEFFECSISVR